MGHCFLDRQYIKLLKISNASPDPDSFEAADPGPNLVFMDLDPDPDATGPDPHLRSKV